MTEKPNPQIIARALAAKQFIDAADVDPLPDALLVRASVTYGMLERKGWIVIDDEDDMDMAHAIALIASGFADDIPSTPQRAALFAAKLDDVCAGCGERANLLGPGSAFSEEQ